MTVAVAVAVSNLVPAVATAAAEASAVAAAAEHETEAAAAAEVVTIPQAPTKKAASSAQGFARQRAKRATISSRRRLVCLLSSRVAAKGREPGGGQKLERCLLLQIRKMVFE